MCAGARITSVQSHGGHVYAALLSRERKGSFVRVYNPSAWPWIQLREIRLPCDGVRLITLNISTEHIYACCWSEHTIFKLTHESVLERRHGKRGEGEAGELHSPYLCHSDADGTLLVADHDNRRLQLLRRDGQWQLTRVPLQQQRVWPRRAVYTRERLYVVGWEMDQMKICIYLYEPTHEQEPSSEDNQETSTGDKSTSADDS